MKKHLSFEARKKQTCSSDDLHITELASSIFDVRQRSPMPKT
jgi:hypothetical protein